jgi:hypothetical protein
MSVLRVKSSESVIPLRPKKLRLPPEPKIANHGDEVTIKGFPPPELKHLEGKVGTWQGRLGSYSHVHFPSIGTVAIHSSLLIVM